MQLQSGDDEVQPRPHGCPGMGADRVKRRVDGEQSDLRIAKKWKARQARQGVKTECRRGVQNEVKGCPKWGKATDTTDKTDRGEIHDTHKPHKTYRPHKSHEKVCRQCVQNGGKRCPKWFGVVPSVSDGGSKLLSRSESATTELFCTGVSRLSRMLFENLIKLETRCAQRLSNVSGMIRR